MPKIKQEHIINDKAIENVKKLGAEIEDSDKLLDMFYDKFKICKKDLFENLQKSELDLSNFKIE